MHRLVVPAVSVVGVSVGTAVAGIPYFLEDIFYPLVWEMYYGAIPYLKTGIWVIGALLILFVFISCLFPDSTGASSH